MTNNPDEKEWDKHGDYQWTYFSDEMKERVSFFLSERLHGKNIEIGGGWYLHYPNSTVVDLSSVCLKHNPAKEKLQFDLEELAEGNIETVCEKRFRFEKYLPYLRKILKESI